MVKIHSETPNTISTPTHLFAFPPSLLSAATVVVVVELELPIIYLKISRRVERNEYSDYAIKIKIYQ